MSKVATIDALMESAIMCFAKEGYEGASLRDIARSAGVPLSTIHLYFGSKSELFGAARNNAWAELDRERHMLLDQALEKAGDALPPLAELVHALAYPVVRRALSTNPRDAAQIQLLRGVLQRDLATPILDVADRSVMPWIDAMARSFQSLTRAEVVWAFSFIVGAIYSWQLIEHRYDRLIGEAGDRSVDEVTADIVSFCCGGVQAIAEAHTSR